ncbi:methionine ABC transporter ATP-binding protein [Rhodomicrobium lacus]|uniref:methionine ABC transporter ATP-binding protein n=1 Tax=Rhodomicrobium lacus TaxID=2498452 RepID=UPI0026E3379B|nr:ATP-binding cassette domain-containing protein [Rhodomicrobium lacus]WKW51281.1 ATP-binding cassette domain-containing protein [Rhodomicrobium lacus]
MIHTKGVSKVFNIGGAKISAVEDVNMHVKFGEIFGIIGYSGAGKSTLIRLLNGLEKPTSGSVVVAGRDLGRASDKELRLARLKIGMIFQHFNLLWSRTVRENIAFSLEIAGASRQKINARVAELVDLVGLQGRENAYPSQLSGGQKQRVGIARALANDPEVLLCDEVTSALDPQTTGAVLNLLLDINKKLNLTVVLITHEMHVVQRICHRVAVMENGRIVEEGDVVSVFTNPQQEITRRFVKQVSHDGDTDLLAQRPLSGTVVKLTFIGVPAHEPVLAEAILHFGRPINVLHGKLSQTRAGIFGELYAHLDEDDVDLNAVFDFFRARNVSTDLVAAA